MHILKYITSRFSFYILNIYFLIYISVSTTSTKTKAGRSIESYHSSKCTSSCTNRHRWNLGLLLRSTLRRNLEILWPSRYCGLLRCQIIPWITEGVLWRHPKVSLRAAREQIIRIPGEIRFSRGETLRGSEMLGISAIPRGNRDLEISWSADEELRNRKELRPTKVYRPEELSRKCEVLRSRERGWKVLRVRAQSILSGRIRASRRKWLSRTKCAGPFVLSVHISVDRADAVLYGSAVNPHAFSFFVCGKLIDYEILNTYRLKEAFRKTINMLL